MKTLIFSIVALIVLNTQLAAMPNPAAAYCITHGGQLSQKGQNIGIGICRFPDGTECSSWSYIGGDCKPGMFRDWIDKNVSKNSQLYFGVATAGYISNKAPPNNISRFNANKKLHFSERRNGVFYYMRMIVQSRNQNARVAQSHPAKIQVKKNGLVINTYLVPPIRNGGNSKPIDLFIPLRDKGFYAFYLITAGSDEVQNSQEHHLFDNVDKKPHKNKTANKMTVKQLRAKRLAEWFKKHPRKNAKNKQQNNKPLRPDQIRAKRLSEWKKAHPQ